MGPTPPGVLVGDPNSIGSAVVRTRAARRIAVVATGVLVPLLVFAAPALADSGEVKGPSLGAAKTLLYFVVTPLGIFAIIAGLSLLPSALSKPRYRPGKPWEHGPKWVGGPATAPIEPTSESTARGGASAEW